MRTEGKVNSEMAVLKNMEVKIKVNGTRSIKRVTKAVNRLATALSRCDKEARGAVRSLQDFANILPILCEIETEKNADDKRIQS